MNNCEHIKSILIPWLTGELEPEEARLVENHLAECPECRREAEELRVFLPELEAALQDEPLELSPERRNAIRRASTPSRWWERLGAIAAVFLVIGLALSVVLPAMKEVLIDRCVIQRSTPPEGRISGLEKSMNYADTVAVKAVAAPTAAFPAAPASRASRKPSTRAGRAGMAGNVPAAANGAVGHASAVAMSDTSGVNVAKSAAMPVTAPAAFERGNAASALGMEADFTPPAEPEPVDAPAEVEIAVEGLPLPQEAPVESGVGFGGGSGNMTFAAPPLPPEGNTVDFSADGMNQVQFIQPERVVVVAADSISRMEALPEVKAELADQVPAMKEIRKKNDTGFAVAAVAMDMEQDQDAKDKFAKIPMISEIPADMMVRVPSLVVNALPPMIPVAAEPVSTFGIDTDTASYVMNRDRIRNRLPVDPSGVRPEAFVNYLDYHYEAPQEQEGAFRCVLNASRHPFRPEHVILAVGIQGRQLGPDVDNKPQFGVIVDASGSMALNDRWTPAVQSVELLRQGIGENGNLITTYITDRAPGEFQLDLPEQPGGSANWLPGVLDTCDRMAAMPKPMDAPANNQVLVITDGIFSPDPASQEELLQLAESKRAEGFTMNVLGFGEAGNNEFWEKFAEKGGGAFLYVDGPDEVERIFTDQFEARFRPIAEDVKIQVEFNPAAVAAYRQIGYEDRALTQEQFRDDTVRTAPVGSGQAVTALYELELNSNVTPESPLATVRVRYRDPGSFGAREFERYFNAGQVADDFTATPEPFRYAVLMGEWAESLRFPEAAGVGQASGIMAFLPAPADWKQREFMQLLQQMR